MITIREMQIDDLEEVTGIERKNFSVPWTETGFFSFLIREDVLLLVAEEEGKILGYSGVVMVLDEGDITNVSIAPERQNQGIGKKLLDELIRRTEKAGVTTLHLEVRPGNAAAVHLYEKLGFRKAGIRKNYYEAPREDGWIMTRTSGQDQEDGSGRAACDSQ